MGSYNLAKHFVFVIFFTFFQNSVAEDEEWINSLHFSSDQGNLEYAVKQCAANKMMLAVVDEEYKHNAIHAVLSINQNDTNPQYYIGGCRMTEDSLQAYNAEFRWYNGERLSFRNFGEGRPDNTLNFATAPLSQLSLKFEGNDTYWWDANTRQQLRYICEPPKEPEVKGPPEPSNQFQIEFTHKQIKGFEQSVKNCKLKYKKSIIRLDSEEKRDSFFNILIANDDRQTYYIDAKRPDAKSPYVWYTSTVKADYKYWGTGEPSQNYNDKCAIVWYDPTSDGLKWKSANCDRLHYVACQAKVKQGEANGDGDGNRK